MRTPTPQTRTSRTHFPQFADLDPSDDNIDYLVDTFHFTQGDDLPDTYLKDVVTTLTSETALVGFYQGEV